MYNMEILPASPEVAFRGLLTPLFSFKDEQHNTKEHANIFQLQMCVCTLHYSQHIT